MVRGARETKKRAEADDENDWGLAKIAVVLRGAGFTTSEIYDYTFSQAELLLKLVIDDRAAAAELTAQKTSDAILELLIKIGLVK